MKLEFWNLIFLFIAFIGLIVTIMKLEFWDLVFLFIAFIAFTVALLNTNTI